MEIQMQQETEEKFLPVFGARATEFFSRFDSKLQPDELENLKTETISIHKGCVNPKLDKIQNTTNLVVGYVQSGKTSHMFGLMTAAADEGFGIFVLLTTDNILLQQQTFKRAERDLCDFCVCDENDYLKFCANNMKKPAVVVLKKNGRVLRQWKNNFASTQPPPTPCSVTG